ncbi:23S rRNA (pseudouridine(1915)-N(3))-methyltransferase RlmH [Ruminococcaceae bacterium OttesenSCG-928-A16]|nr:23S rRNA (pseudouridine(1915)-N(3))-methyltransferase RlmH [Ruminococcaceae bacterium OttesenSCG-928-A16]
MQRITVIALGKLNSPFYAAGVAEYAKRLAPLCKFEMVELAEESIDEKTAGPAAIQAALEKEAARILAAVPKGARIVALCVEGKPLTSEIFADYLNTAALSGAGDVAFVIGSSHGLSPGIKQKAALRLSISAMTLPHQLARLVLTEQIYRAFMIRTGSKYHK